MKHWFPDAKEPKDLDYISKEKIMTRKEEHHWYDSFQYILDHNKDNTYVDPNFLYTLKVSHAAWPVFWEKTMSDIMFMKEKGCKLDKTLYNKLYKEWEVLHRDKRINLNVKNEQFFNKNITREYDHDWLHGFLAFGKEPMHNKIRKDPNSPLCSKKLWNKLSYEDQLKCAMEETYVVATERYVVQGIPRKLAKIKSLKNLITSMTKGWFNLFLIENYRDLLYYNNNHWFHKLEILAYEKRTN